MEFTIENNFLCVRVQSRGAELCSVVKKETGQLCGTGMRLFCSPTAGG